MNIRIICAGKLKERFYEAAAAEYGRRLGRFCKLETSEVADEAVPERMSTAEERQAVDREGARLLERMRPGEHVIALCVDGKKMSSEAFAARLQALFDQGKSTVDFVIGGSLGLADAVLARADERISVSDMTLPHRLCRIVLLEQIYRAFKINAHEPYHK